MFWTNIVAESKKLLLKLENLFKSLDLLVQVVCTYLKHDHRGLFYRTTWVDWIFYWLFQIQICALVSDSPPRSSLIDQIEKENLWGKTRQSYPSGLIRVLTDLPYIFSQNFDCARGKEKKFWSRFLPKITSENKKFLVIKKQ